MWIVRLALNRPYTFVVLAILILIAAPVVILRTPTDIFPSIDIPVISMAWQYTGLSPEELEGRLTTPYEKAITTLVDNVEHIESTTLNGEVIVKVYLQPGASLDTANAQVSSVSEYMLKNLPPGILPPEIINFSASSVPILQLGLSSQTLTEQQLNDYGLNFIRTQIVTVPGIVVPNVYGGKQRAIMIFLDPKQMQANHLSPIDILNAVSAQNVVEPGGTAKIGTFEYDVRLNSTPTTIQGLANLPIRDVNGTVIYLRDVASVTDGFTPQTNIVRQDGHRGVLISVLKSGTASTLDVVKGVFDLLPRIRSTVPTDLKITPIGNQATFVRGSISGVVREGIIAACLTGLMILLFLASWRSTLIIAVSIPLSILTSIIILSLLGQTINIMTLGGLALAVGILVDDATVEIENTNRYLEEGYGVRDAILAGAAQIAIPALVSTLCICIVFLPMFFLAGVSRYLFVPLAEAVVFAMLASYMFSRTLVPTMALYLLKPANHHAPLSRNPFARFQQGFERVFEHVRSRYESVLERLVRARKLFIPIFLGCCLLTFLLIPFLGQNFFPSTDNGSFILHVRAKTGTRIEETARLCDQVETSIRGVIPPAQMDNILDNIGLPYSPLNTQHSTSGLFGAADGDILVSLHQKHTPTEEFVRELRQRLPREFPGTTFYFLPSDIVTQILNFGLPAPLDVQIDGRDDAGNRKVADKIMAEMRQVPGLVDLRLQEPDDYPVLDLKVDRTKGAARRLHRARHRHLRAEHPLRLHAAHTAVLSQQEWRELQHRGRDPAVQDRFAAGARKHSAHGARRAYPGDPRRCDLDLALGGAARHPALQHPPHPGSLCRRAGPRSGRGSSRRAAHRRSQQGLALARQLRADTRPGERHAQLLHRSALRSALLHPPHLSAHRGELPVLARSLHHHHGPARGACRHRALPLLYPHHALGARADGLDHVHGCRYGELHPRRLLRQGPARRHRRRSARRGRSRRNALPSRRHDRAGDDHRHGAHGARPR